MSDSNLGIQGKPSPVPAPVILPASTAGPDVAALAAAHGQHTVLAVDAASQALFAANQKLGPANAALGDAVMADGNAEAPHYDQNGNPAA